MDERKRLIKVLAHHVVYNGMPLKVAVNILNQCKNESDTNQPDKAVCNSNPRRSNPNHFNAGLLAFG